MGAVGGMRIVGAVGGMRIVGAVGGMGGVWGAAPGTDPHPDAFLPDFAPTPKLTRLAKESRKLPGTPAVTATTAIATTATTATTATMATATTTTANAPRQTPAAAALPTSPPPGEATVSRMQSLSAKERGRRLVLAAEQGAVEELRALIAAGADVRAWDEWGCTALHWAAWRGDVEAARLLVGAGAAVDARDSFIGWTPLHHAAHNGHAEVADALLDAGADRVVTDAQGRTALDFARQFNHRRLVEMLS
ncbi:ankyrin repeat domain-containing protein 65-like [Schistocerca americana]|uniref:ankyrin repeat domain-containing protein 65-like n=1 Tax=Schistocerca americana TaxID=7009 RepID=UPI001F4F48B2|nr:ankyrin repeat domain-containing protein 65-like [Schistocerca americana]